MNQKKSKPIPRSRRRTPQQPMPPMPPVDITEKKARKLPMFGPNIAIDVPLHLWPAYKDLYMLVPMNLGEVADTEKRLGKRKPAGVVWVKRLTGMDAVKALLKED